MKKLTLLIIMLISFSTYGAAQNSYNEVVYLKNGSVIRGVVIEQVPNVSIKIKTIDGSIFAYPLSDVEKITKEEAPTNDYDKARRQARTTLRGYKGFVDGGYQFNVDYYNANSLEISTSHGYQFNNYIFVGGGIGVNYYTDASIVSVPFFTNFRVNFINNKVTPFADFKLGYSAGDLTGTYASLAVGVRFAMSKKTALNLRLEYSANEQAIGLDYDYNDFNYYNDYTLNSLGLKIGFEF